MYGGTVTQLAMFINNKAKMNIGLLNAGGKSGSLAALLLVVLVAGCANIAFFPKAPAQKAADKVIDDIWPAAPAPPVVAEKPAVTPSVAAKVPVEPAKTETKK
jgi:hypothetical protein